MEGRWARVWRRGHGERVGGGGAVCVRVGVRARGWGCAELGREHHCAADRGRGASGAGQSRPGSPRRSWC